MPVHSHLPALLLAVLSLSACGEPPAPTAPVSPERFVIELASAYCAFGLRCESASDAQRFSAFCHPIAAERKLAYLLERQPHMAYDREAAARCLATIEDATGRCVQPVCEPVLIGTLALGAECDEPTQCAPGLTCAGGGPAMRCSGVCELAADRGERCRDDVECAPGLRCDGGRCAARANEGERCERRDDCAMGLACDREAGECYRLDDAEGRACNERGPDRCPVPTDCVDGRCVRYELGRVAGPGEACDEDECAADHACEDGVCTPYPGLTEECDDDDLPCMEGRCVDDTCQLLPPRAPCSRDDECTTDRCMGVCEVPSAVGARCETERDCANGLRCDEGRCVVRGPCG